jgi:hypothetical protein
MDPTVEVPRREVLSAHLARWERFPVVAGDSDACHE